MGWVARESSSGLGCGVGVMRERCSPPYRAASLALPLLMPGSAGVEMGGLYFYCDDEVKAGESQWSQSSRTPP